MKHLLIALIVFGWLATAVSRPTLAQSGYPAPGTPPGYPGPVVTRTPEPTGTAVPTSLPTSQPTPLPTSEIPTNVEVTAVDADAGSSLPAAMALLVLALVVFLYIWRS